MESLIAEIVKIIKQLDEKDIHRLLVIAKGLASGKV